MPAGEEYSWCRKAVIVNGHRISAEEKPAPANVIIIVMYFKPFVWLQHRGRKPSSDQELHIYENCVLL